MQNEQRRSKPESAETPSGEGLPSSVLLADSMSDDGGLYNLGWYLAWNPSDPQAILDGLFSAEELRAIADHMDNYSANNKSTNAEGNGN